MSTLFLKFFVIYTTDSLKPLHVKGFAVFGAIAPPLQTLFFDEFTESSFGELGDRELGEDSDGCGCVDAGGGF